MPDSSLHNTRNEYRESVNLNVTGESHHTTVHYHAYPPTTDSELAELWQQLATVQFQLIQKLKARQ